ncbi:MAG: diaminopimelate epimerase [Geovibrio sp.]|nr:diaminopimelate epimerase [Geovibrio sp.]
MRRRKNETKVHIETAAGVLQAELAGNQQVKVDMGEPRFGWQEIPLSSDVDTLSLPLNIENLSHPVAVNMGNPHAVFFVDTHERVELERLGPVIERHELFPERVNVSIARVMGAEHIKLDVWERGAGLTLSCGTAACATLVAAIRRNLIKSRRAQIQLPGGDLLIEWRDDNHIWMTGVVAESFRGEFAI